MFVPSVAGNSRKKRRDRVPRKAQKQATTLWAHQASVGLISTRDSNFRACVLACWAGPAHHKSADFAGLGARAVRAVHAADRRVYRLVNKTVWIYSCRKETPMSRTEHRTHYAPGSDHVPHWVRRVWAWF